MKKNIIRIVVFSFCFIVLTLWNNRAMPPNMSKPKTRIFAKKISKEKFGTYFGSTLGLWDDTEQWQKELELLSEHEIGFARLNSDVWDMLEPKRGTYDWRKLDSLLSLFDRYKIEMLFTLPISASWNSSGAEGAKFGRNHYPAKDFADIENFCRNIAHRYKGRIKYWEAWNEPDLDEFWKAKPNAKEYLDVLKAMHKGLKAGNPECLVVMGGIANPLKTEYFSEFMELGAGAYFDIANIHQYVLTTHDLRNGFEGIRGILKKHGLSKRKLWVTEISTTPVFFLSDDEAWEQKNKADYFIKSYALLLTLGADKIFWHAFRNGGKNVGLDRDLDFSLLEADFTKLPAYFACKNILATLDGAKKVKVRHYSKKAYCFEFFFNNTLSSHGA